jgi:hypothetical protein
MGYERQTTINCVEDWVETNPIEYEGAYSFIHFGTHTYSFIVKKGVVTIEEDFESLSAKEHSVITNVIINNNKILAYDSSGRDFKARFVKLKCEIDTEMLSGFFCLLVNEELLYVLQGD